MTWYTLNCGDAMLSGDALQEAIATFTEFYQRAALPPGAAIYSRHESAGELHCELILYFTPAARAVARAIGAHRCGRPATQGLSRIAGQCPELDE